MTLGDWSRDTGSWKDASRMDESTERTEEAVTTPPCPEHVVRAYLAYEPDREGRA